MTNPVIPAGFKPVIENYSFGAPGGVRRTEVAGGLARYGMIWPRGTQEFRVTLVLNGLDFPAWDIFFNSTIQKGALSFEMPLDSGYGLNNHTVNIIPGSYTVSRTGGIMWVVSFVVEAESQFYSLSQEDIDSYNFWATLTSSEEFLYGALFDRIAQFANEDTLVLQL